MEIIAYISRNSEFIIRISVLAVIGLGILAMMSRGIGDEK